MTALPLNLTLQTVTDFVGNNSAIQLSTLRLGITSDSSVTTQTSSVIQATTTNANLVIAPNGTGALVASIPDGTATGGNARGNNAVDLQSVRTANTQVVSGARSVIVAGQNNSVGAADSIIVGGIGNTLNKVASFIGGGQSNSMSGTFGSNCVIVGGQGNVIGSRTHVVIGGGQNNSCLGGWNTIAGGFNNSTNDSTYNTVGGGNANVAGNGASTVSGGQSNTASGAHSTVVGGQSNVSSGQHSVSGGNGNTASGTGSFCFGSTSNGNTASGVGAFNFNGQPEGSTVSGNYGINLSGGATTISGEGGLSSGYNNQVLSAYGIATGLQSVSYLFCQESRANGKFVLLGDAQQSSLTSRRLATLTTGGTTILSLDGTGVTSLIIPNGNNRLWAVKVVATAFVSVAGGTLVLGDSYMGEFTLLFKRVGGTSSVVGVNAGNIIYDTNMATAAFTFAAGASQDLQITFKAPTTASATTFRCVAKVELVEVAY
jgi:hypothetical protein